MVEGQSVLNVLRIVKGQRKKNNKQQLVTTGHTQLPRRGVANVSSLGYLSGNTTSERP